MLTFVDMSRLQYLSKSVSSDTKFLRKRQVDIPVNTGMAIAEASSEEDDEEESPTKIN